MAPRARLTATGFRTQFPALAHQCYLASCSFGARSSALEAAMAEMLEDVHRDGVPWPRYEARTQALRERAARLLGTTQNHVALMPDVSTAAFQAASTLAWGQRPRIVTSAWEFPSVAHVWLAQRSRGAEVLHVPACDATAAAEAFLAAIDERTALVSIPLVAYGDGAALPVHAIAARAGALGAKVFVDAYQAAGTQPIDVEELACDFLATGAYKYLLGLPGLAFLYARAPAEGQPPSLTGWFGRTEPFSFDAHTLDYSDAAQRFEVGTPSIPSIYAADATLGLLEQVDLAHVRQHIATLSHYAHERLLAQGETVVSPADVALRGPMVALRDAQPEALARWLAGRRITVSPRGRNLRISLHYYNAHADVDALCEALREYRLR